MAMRQSRNLAHATSGWWAHRSLCLAPPVSHKRSTATFGGAAAWAGLRHSDGSLDLCNTSLHDHGEQQDCGACGIMQLGQLTHPSALKTVWQQQLQPACQEALQQLHELALLQLTSNRPPSSEKVVERTQYQQQQQQQWQSGQLWSLGYLQALDQLLGSLQQILLVCGLLKDQHAKNDWQTAAAAVYIEARTAEQDICSDTLLQQALLLAEQQQQLLQQQQQEIGRSDSTAAGPPSTHAASQSCLAASEALLLAKALKKHMQLEGLNPQGFAGINPANASKTTAQVLSMDEQRAILSGLQAEHRVLLNRMQEVLLNPAAAPVVQMDASSRDVLLQPLQRHHCSSAESSQLQVADAAEGFAEEQPTSSATQQASPATAVASVGQDQLVDVALDLELVQQLLQLHPAADVRADVWSAGVLQRLDKVLLLWKDLAEVRRKIASVQGYSSYSRLVLQHSLMGSHDAAGSMCEQLAAALQPAAKAEADRLKVQRQKGVAVLQGSDQLQGSNLEFLLHQSTLELISHDDLQALQPHMQLQQVMSGFDQLLQLTLGLSLRPRPTAPGEVWNDRVHVYELYDCYLDKQLVHQPLCQQGPPESSNSSAAVTGQLLGTIYLDPFGGYSAQLLLYGLGYSWLGHDTLQHGQGSTSSASSTTQPAGAPVPCAVALGLQSQGILTGTHSQLALGLWELCHELGHAVNFVLSSTAAGHHWSAPGLGANHLTSNQQGTTDEGNTAQAGKRPRLYHMHAAWLPLELLELPSTLFEVFCMDPKCLQVLCQHCNTGEQLSLELAIKLAKFMQNSHYNPLLYQQKVLAMLFDLQLTGITGRQLGRHAAHAVWQEVMTADGLAVLPKVEASLQQMATLPRLLVSSGQGYGYAVAWHLAQLVMPSLLQHIHYGMEEVARRSAKCSSGLEVDVSADGEEPAQARVAGICMWRQLFSSGVELSDSTCLDNLLAGIQNHTSSTSKHQASSPNVPLG